MPCIACSYFFDRGISLQVLCHKCTLKEGTVQLSLREPFKSMLETRQKRVSPPNL